MHIQHMHFALAFHSILAICFAHSSPSFEAPFGEILAVGQNHVLVKESILPRDVLARQNIPTASQTLPTSTISPTASATDSIANIPLATSIVNDQFITFTVTSNDQKDNGATSGSISLGCANCSTTGSLTIGGQSIQFSRDHVSGGILNVTANAVSGYFEMDLSAAALTYNWSKNILKWPIVGIKTEEGTVGIVAILVGNFDIALEEEMDITFGARFQIPDGSHLTLDVTNLSSSSHHGFTPSTGLQVSAIPFNANFSNPTLDLGLSLSLQIVADFQFLDFHAQAGFYLGMPQLGLNIAVPTNVDANCDPVSPGATGIPANLGNALNIIPSAYVDIGLTADAGFGDSDKLVTHQLGNESVNLPTACLLWDSSAGTLAPASVVEGKAAASSTAAAVAGPRASDGFAWGVLLAIGVGLFSGMALL